MSGQTCHLYSTVTNLLIGLNRMCISKQMLALSVKLVRLASQQSATGWKYLVKINRFELGVAVNNVQSQNISNSVDCKLSDR